MLWSTGTSRGSTSFASTDAVDEGYVRDSTFSVNLPCQACTTTKPVLSTVLYGANLHKCNLLNSGNDSVLRVVFALRKRNECLSGWVRSCCKHL
jgi:hypothetical protein